MNSQQESMARELIAKQVKQCLPSVDWMQIHRPIYDEKFIQFMKCLESNSGK